MRANRRIEVLKWYLDELVPILSLRTTVERLENLHRCPLTVDILVWPTETPDHLLYETVLRMGGAEGDPLFDVIWDHLSQRIKLPDPTLRDWSETSSSTGHTYFEMKINVSPDEARAAVMGFFDTSDLTFLTRQPPFDGWGPMRTYLRHDCAVLLMHDIMAFRSMLSSVDDACDVLSEKTWVVSRLMSRFLTGKRGGEVEDLVFDLVEGKDRWQEVLTYLGTHGRVRFAWEEGLG